MSIRDFLFELTFEPLTIKNWKDFEVLFGVKGACGNCWCMSFRREKKEFEAGKLMDGNKQAMKALVEAGQPTGILCFHRDVPIAWCAFAPRKQFLKLAKSRVHKPIDEHEVWSVPCTFVSKSFRRKGVSVALLKGLIEYALQQGISTIEAYPLIPTQGTLPDAFAWVGIYSSFERAGFKVVDRTSKNRPMVRYELQARHEKA